MGKKTKIEWATATWNPFYGCIKVSPGCKNCYMYRDMKRYGRDPRVVTRAKSATFNAPLKWKEPEKIFTCSWSDFFIEEADEWRNEAWDIVRRTPHHTYLILTKRIENVRERLPIDWGEGWPNVWLGVSAENQEYADKRIPKLIDIPAKVRFLSLEPLLGPITGLYHYFSCNSLYKAEFWGSGHRVAQQDIETGEIIASDHDGKIFRDGLDIHWTIVGGESGPSARPMKAGWVQDILDECVTSDVPFFFKQWGGNRKVGGAWGGRLLQEREWNEFPE